MTDVSPSRRRILQLASASAIGGLAGCSQGDSSGPSAENEADGSGNTTTNTSTGTSPPAAEDCTEIGGSVDAGTTLDGCYLVTETLDVASGELTVTGGSQLRFADGTGMEVRSEGSLVAEGTDSDPIRMIGETDARGYWNGIAIHSQKPANTMQFVEVSSAGGGRWDPCCPRSTRKAGLNVWDDGIVTVQNCTFSDNAGYGLAATSSADLRDFASNTFADNEQAAVTATTDTIDALDTASTYGGVVEVRAAAVADSGTWSNIDTTYRMDGRPEIVDDAAVTVEAGAQFVFTQDAGIRVASGSLAIEGTEGAPVVMRGATQIPGFWRGLSIQSKKPDNRLEYLEIAHGGSGNWDPCCPNDSAPANVNVFEDAIASVVNVRFADSSNYGLLLSPGSELESFKRNVFENIEEASVRITANNLGALDTETDYGDGPVSVRGNDVTEDATWGSINTVYDVQQNSVLTITDDATVTIPPGADFEFREDAGLLVEKEGSLSAVGDPADLITLTGTTETAGWWKGIAVTSPSRDNEIASAEIAHGGSDKWDPCCPHESNNANVNVFEGGYLELRDSFVSDSENFATWVDGSSTLERTNNALDGQAGSA
jgi:hypothetical protein